MKNINLNLLKALDALLTEQNVSKAGEKLDLTQSAMSIALKQLRELYEDELLVRGTQGRMQLTTFAKTLIQPVKQALYQADVVFSANIAFDPSTTQRTFHIGMSDYLAFVLLPSLMQKITRNATNIKIVQHPINHLGNLSPFDEYRLDLVIGDFPQAPVSLKTTNLFTDKGVIVADKNHPAMKEKQINLATFLKYPQIFVALEFQPEKNFIAEALKKMGHKVHMSLITPHTLIALQTLPGTLLMTNTVERLAIPFLKPLGLAMRELPYKLSKAKYEAKLYWHARDQADPGHQWLRKIIKESC